MLYILVAPVICAIRIFKACTFDYGVESKEEMKRLRSFNRNAWYEIANLRYVGCRIYVRHALGKDIFMQKI